MKTAILRTFCLATLLFFFWFRLTAQVLPVSVEKDTADYPYWIKMMQDPDANYFTTVSAFEKYWKNRPITKGCGWKVFKRWEYIMRGRISNDGGKPKPDAVYNEWQQFLSSNRSPNGTWTSLGPSVIPQPGPAGYLGLGRLNVVAFHPTDQNKLYAGAPSGGFWLTSDNGVTWSTTTDQMPTIGVSAIVVDYANTQVIYIGTGDRDHGDAPGMGIFKSIDGGNSWSESKTGMGNVTVCKLLQHPINAQILLAATTEGVYRSTNGGAGWILTNTGDFKDICFKPDNPNVVYAESSSNFYRSSDNGLTFVQISVGLTTGQRGAIAVTPANPSYVYFLQSDNSSGFKGVYKSTDAGLTFSTRSSSPNILDWSCDGSGSGGQGWYDLAIVADPNNAEILYVGGVDVWKSNNGGQTWMINSHWYGGCGVPAVHADCHFLGFSPVNNRLYAGNDGGIYYTSDGGTTWTDCTVGMTIGQIYKLGQSQTDASKTINGFQDNGTYTLMSNGWNATGGGDGMECAVDFQNALITYHTIYFGSIFRRINNTNEVQIAGDGVFGINESGDWVTPFILSESNSKKMFVGYKNVWYCPDATAGILQWTKISEGEATNCYILEQSPANVDILYVVRSQNIVRSENINDTNPSWTTCALPGGFTPTDLEAHPTEPNTVYATAGNKVYKSTDKANSWTILPGTLPDIPVNTIVFDKNSSEGLYIGTQTGILYKNSSMSYWINFSLNFPIADVRELEIFYDSNPSGNKLMACTFGRGLWRSDLFSPPSIAPVASFTFNPTIPCSGQSIQITDLSLYCPTTWNWSFSPSTVTYLNGTTNQSQNPVVQLGGNTNFIATLNVSNAFGTSQKSIQIPFGGEPPPKTETFESGTIPSAWTIFNPDSFITWSVASVGGNGPGTQAAYVNFYDYPATGQIDEMVLSPLNLNGSLHPWLEFRVAYRRWAPGYNDGLKIFISHDCGATWSNMPIYERSGVDLATGIDQSNRFVPSEPSDWRTDSIDLTPYIYMSVTIKFQAINQYGNNLYIDDIAICEHPLLNVKNLSVPTGTNICFNATQTIQVAGSGAYFNILNGGSATFISGQNIFFHTGLNVSQGGYLKGYISSDSTYCNDFASFYPTGNSLNTETMANSPIIFSHSLFSIYPNPTNQDFTICRIGLESGDPIVIDVYDLRGYKVLSHRIVHENKSEIVFSHFPEGMYLVKLITDHNVETFKLLKIR